jgi:hypothetical protein
MHDDADGTDTEIAPHQKRDLVLILALAVAALLIAREWHDAPAGLAGLPGGVSPVFMYSQSDSAPSTGDVSMVGKVSEIPIPRARPHDLQNQPPNAIASVQSGNSYR